MDIFKLLKMQDFTDVNEICAPFLISQNINFFKHLRIFNNGEFICLSNNGEWIDYYFKNKLYCHSTFINQPLINRQKVLFSDNLYISENIVREVSKKFNINKTTIIAQPSLNYTDIYFFGSADLTNEIFQQYTNNTDFFNKFIYYFQDKANKLIQKANKIIIPKSQKSQDKSSPFEKNSQNSSAEPSVFSNTSIDRYYLWGDFSGEHLTKREVQILSWLAKGKSMEEIATILEISKRTAEQHVNNVKEKLGCYKQTTLIFLLAKLGILTLADNEIM